MGRKETRKPVALDSTQQEMLERAQRRWLQRLLEQEQAEQAASEAQQAMQELCAALAGKDFVLEGDAQGKPVLYASGGKAAHQKAARAARRRAQRGA